MENPRNNKDRYFRGQYPDEEVIAFFRCHWVAILPDFLMYIFFVGLFITAMVFFVGIPITEAAKPFMQAATVLLVGVMTYFFHHIFVNLINHFLETVIITNFRVVEVKKTIFLKDSQDSFYMEMIQDVEKDQVGLFKNILRFGELVIRLSSNDTRVIKYVPNPDYHFRLMNKIKQEYIQKRIQEKMMVQRQQHGIQEAMMTVHPGLNPSLNQGQGIGSPQQAMEKHQKPPRPKSQGTETLISDDLQHHIPTAVDFEETEDIKI